MQMHERLCFGSIPRSGIKKRLKHHGGATNLNAHSLSNSVSSQAVANAYDQVGDHYRSYADGNGLDDPSSESNRFAQADTIVWEAIRKTIEEVRATGVKTLRVLDAGCGPGTWTKRVAAYACHLGLDVEQQEPISRPASWRSRGINLKGVAIDFLRVG
jgi:hypothetical protein